MTDLNKCIHVSDDTPAFICAVCGAISLDSDSLCNPLGRGFRKDWCGTKSLKPPVKCQHYPDHLKYFCKKCGLIAVNPELLCEPELYGVHKKEGPVDPDIKAHL